jgi:hypothetical protein
VRKLAICAFVLACLCFASAPVTFADSSCSTCSLQDIGFNVNGTYYASTFSVPGLSTALFNETSGVGTLTLTFNPGAAGTYSVDAWIFNALSTPMFNEYGATSAAGPASGQSWQIDVPDYDSDSNHTGTIIANTQGNSLDNTNHIPGNADNYSGGCVNGPGVNCNDITSMAMGFKFTLTAGEEEVITFDLTTSAPASGFYMEQIQPVDTADGGSNATEQDYFFSGAAVSQPICTVNCAPPPMPENGSWILLLMGVCGAFALKSFRNKFSASTSA